MRQKPLEPDIQDNWEHNYFQGHGAHMTLMVFVQGTRGRRSPEAISRRADNRRQRKADKKGGETRGNGSQQGYGGPRVGKSGGKGSSAVAGKTASSSSASHKGKGWYTGYDHDVNTFDGDKWEASHQAQPSGVCVNGQTHQHYGYDPSNQAHRNAPKRDPYEHTRGDSSLTNPWAGFGGYAGGASSW